MQDSIQRFNVTDPDAEVKETVVHNRISFPRTK